MNSPLEINQQLISTNAANFDDLIPDREANLKVARTSTKIISDHKITPETVEERQLKDSDDGDPGSKAISERN